MAGLWPNADEVGITGMPYYEADREMICSNWFACDPCQFGLVVGILFDHRRIGLYSQTWFHGHFSIAIFDLNGVKY